MRELSDLELYEYIREDLPYFDLTTHLLELPSIEMRLSILTREEIVSASTQEAARIAELLGCRVIEVVASAKRVSKGATLLKIEGSHEKIHQAWKVCQIFLEHACGLATHAHKMLQSARAVNPHCELFVTRKSFPFAKRFTMRSLLCGGVLPHRLGLSESVLIFEQHRNLYESKEEFEEAMRALKHKCVEKKLVIESESLEDAKAMLQLGADVIQMDKSSIETLRALVAYKNEFFPNATILAAGGINQTNASEFAATGVNALVTSALYQAKMADLTAKMERVL